jgi:hypothetical protein
VTSSWRRRGHLWESRSQWEFVYPSSATSRPPRVWASGTRPRSSSLFPANEVLRSAVFRPAPVRKACWPTGLFVSPSHTSVGSFAMSVGPRRRVFAPSAGPHPPAFASPTGTVRKPLHLLLRHLPEAIPSCVITRLLLTSIRIRPGIVAGRDPVRHDTFG